MRRLELHCNGLNALDGTHFFPPIASDELASRLPGRERESKAVRVRGCVSWVEPDHIASAGWGVIFPRNHDTALRESLAPLLERRRAQAGPLYREFVDDDGPCAAYRHSESCRSFLKDRAAATSGPVNPERMPYYLLLVGDPRSIPFGFQAQIGVQYAVGRLDFAHLDEFRSYAKRVVTVETGGAPAWHRAALVGFRHENDTASQVSARYLVGTLEQALSNRRPRRSVDRLPPEAATKRSLLELVTGARAPALLFTAGHGLAFPLGGELRQQTSELQLRRQGALICQDWPGPEAKRQAISKEHYLCAEDFSEDVEVRLGIAFHFACFSAGTPRFDSFHRRQRGPARELAPHPFVARLPQRLLARGALAVIGHVDRAWGYSFYWPKAPLETETFESALRQMLDGRRVGLAMEFFGQRHGELSAELARRLDALPTGERQTCRDEMDDGRDLAGLWTAWHDARNYVVLGDPAVRLPPFQGASITPDPSTVSPQD